MRLALAATFVSLCACAERDAALFARRDVVVIVADSLHAAHLSCYGHARDTSPNIDALARAGVRFECAYSQSAWTLPATASLFTGMEQERHGVRRLEERLGEETATLAERFARAGYRTEAVVQNPLVSRYSGLQRGFEGVLQLDWGVVECERAVQRALEIWSAPRARPLFLYVHIVPPHMPYRPPAPFRGRFSGPGVADDHGSIEHCRSIHKAGLGPASEEVLQLAALYDEHIAFADATLGPLLEAIASSRAPGPLTIFTSDHGEAFMQHGSQGHNATVYDEMLRVPLILHARDAPWKARAVAQYVSLLDIAPTLIEWCALERPPAGALQGHSLDGLLRDASPPGAPERALFFSSRYKDRFEKLQIGLRRGRWKAILDGSSGELHLFDLERDAPERRNVAAEHPQRAVEFEARLREWYAARADAARAGQPTQPPAAQELRALGYTDD